MICIDEKGFPQFAASVFGFFLTGVFPLKNSCLCFQVWENWGTLNNCVGYILWRWRWWWWQSRNRGRISRKLTSLSGKSYFDHWRPPDVYLPFHYGPYPWKQQTYILIYFFLYSLLWTRPLLWFIFWSQCRSVVTGIYPCYSHIKRHSYNHATGIYLNSLDFKICCLFQINVVIFLAQNFSSISWTIRQLRFYSWLILEPTFKI